MQSTDMVMIVTKLESAININEPQSIHQQFTRNIKYRDNIAMTLSEYGQNIADESQFLTSTSNVYTCILD
jgi:hypothetical protein